MTSSTTSPSSPPVRTPRRAAYVDAAGDLLIRHGVELPARDPGHVLVRTLVSALCGSDLHRFRGAESYGFDTDVFGHETVGEIVSAGSGSSVGQRVLALPLPAAGRVFADYQAGPEATLIPTPDGLAPEHAVGERNDHRRALPEANGAVRTDVQPYALAIDASGGIDGCVACNALVADGSMIGILGLPDDEPGSLGLDVLTLLGCNLTVSGAMGAQGEPGLRSFREAVAILADARIDVSDLVSHVGDLPTLSRIATHHAEDVSKVLIRFPLEETS